MSCRGILLLLGGIRASAMLRPAFSARAPGRTGLRRRVGTPTVRYLSTSWSPGRGRRAMSGTLSCRGRALLSTLLVHVRIPDACGGGLEVELHIDHTTAVPIRGHRRQSIGNSRI